jgi:pimeloyl-[acyl-carrier protein] methyl ester esterase
MLHLRHFVGRSTLRALLLLSASFSVAGGVVLARQADVAIVDQFLAGADGD